MEIKIQQSASLKNFCTYKTGGNALYFAVADDWKTMLGLREFAKQKNIPWMILGGGSNVLFADEGFHGLVIHNKMNKIHFHSDNMATAESGVNLMKLLLIAGQHNLGGISGLANVPGSVGGAVYGNAGIPDMCIADILVHALILPTGQKKPAIVTPDYFQFSYRHSRLKQTKDLVLSATFRMEPMPAILVRKEIEGYIKTRSLKQPSGNCCGSFFKNPARFPSAGWLIEQGGCKGMKIGGAQVSEKHANFFMNTGSATSSDILNLAMKIHRIVQNKYNVNLEPEVQIVPNNPFSQPAFPNASECSADI